MVSAADIIKQRGALPPRYYRLRWRFDYAGGKVKRGIWDGNGELGSDAAWVQPKSGLLEAFIEGVDRVSSEERIFLGVSGQAYASAQWEAVSRIPMLKNGEKLKPRTYIYGLSFLTATEKLTVWVNGSITRQPLSRHDKKFLIHEHTAGS